MLNTPLWLDNDSSYPAQLDRQALAAIWDEGVRAPHMFVVSERAAGTNYSVDIAVGEALIDGDDEPNQGTYLAESTAIENRAITTPPGSGSRIDLIVLRVNDEAAGGPATNDLTIEVIQGTPGTTPVAPDVPPTAIPLAEVGPISAATTSITDAIITDRRYLAGMKDTPGVIKMSGSQLVPNGWLACDGSEVLRDDYPGLFAAIGTTWGPGDGSTTFALPNFGGRFPQGPSGGLDVGDIGGSSDVTLTASNIPAHTHSLPSHTHTLPSHTHSIDHNHGSITSGSNTHTHSLPSHSHSINHDHPSVTSGSDTHTHSLPSHSHSINHDHPSVTSGSDTHSHSINHDHGSVTSSSNGNHRHNYHDRTDTLASGTSGYPMRSNNSGNDAYDRVTEYAGSHTHTVNLPNYSGTSGSDSHSHSVNLPSFSGTSGSWSGTSGGYTHSHTVDLPNYAGTSGAWSGTSGSGGGGTTSSYGTGGPFSIAPPFAVVPFIIRT